MIKENKNSLDKLRNQIDAIDHRIVKLLDDRSTLAKKTAQHKSKLGAKLYQPSREAEVMRKILGLRKQFPEAALSAIYREIMGASLAMEKPFTVSILGPEATYTNLAAIRHFGHHAGIQFEASIPDVFMRVEKNEADAGIVPIENSTEGVVVHTLDTLVESDLVVSGEIHLPIKHHLLVNAALAKKLSAKKPKVKIRKILSHPQAIAQCRNYLEANFSGVPIEDCTSTAAAAVAAAKSSAYAAIASELAAEKYNLKIFRRGIEDTARNTTRFLILTNPAGITTKKTGNDKTSIAFSMKDKPGALFAMLEPFKRYKINLTKIESRPSKIRNWRYVFFIDMEGYKSDPAITKALVELEKECRFLKILGSYPKQFAIFKK
ncbi:MAG: prephenate dehydratase [Candidatus Lindowbacteria bacterium]|nr:prephenate dehydratase [Candidatus Lindowbacteria bacterium]